MSKVTKTEKILRKATSKWEKFLAEGAFKKTLKEFDEDDAYHFDQDKSDSKPLPPESESATYWVKKGDKVRIYGRDFKGFPQIPEEYRCRYAIVKGFSKENERDVIVQFDDGKVANLDHGNLSNTAESWNDDFWYPCEEQVSEGDTMPEYERYTDPNFPNIEDYPGYEKGDIEFAASFNNKYKDEDGNPYPNLLHKGKPVLINHNGERYIKDDKGRILWLTTTDDWIKEDNLNEMTMGERGMVDAQDGNPPSKIGHGNEEYMAAFNAVMKKMGKEPLPIVKPDQRYLDALQRGNLEEMGPATGHVEGTDAAGVIRQIAADLGEVSGVMNNASSTTTASEFAGFIQAKANELLEAANELGIDGPAPSLQENEKKKFEVGEFVYIVNGSLKGASGKILEPVTTSTGEEGFAIELYSDAKMKVFGKRGDEVIALAGDLESGGTSDDMELYDIDEALIKETVRKILSSKKKVKAIKENNPSSFSMRTTHSSDPEMDQVMDIAADMLEMPTRSRGTITLKSVQSALDARSIDSVIENDMLIIDNKYVIAKKELLPKTAQKISFTKYAADYLSNLQGEQQNLPMEEQERPDFVTSYSADPHLDQIEDYALTVIEKGGNLRQLEDVLNRDGFATFLKGDVLTIDDEFFIGKEENFEISPNEDIRRVGPYVVGYSK